ncbi:MAG TPA: coproporphyrinogen-III oxidase family protein [Bryobacteraceae bacterium]|nr:coproporphyrinogen-III oxidase family protein [Bryobacteraceae bacterium]
MAGVYISYPFCAQKCSFCNFASDVAPAASRQRYERALLSEVRGHRWEWQPETLYLGGGTPSLMPLEYLAELLETIPAKVISEATIECAPGTVTREKAEAWKKSGINRVSLGVQSFLRNELQLTGRRHTPEMVAADLALLRDTGLGNLNLDLIAGLPEQTAASWEESLDWIERLMPPHASIYLFESDEDSRLGKELLSGGVRYGAAKMPSDDRAAEFYERARVRLAKMGLARYEISNFAQRGFESRHNLKYWQLEPYVGFGVDATSFGNGRRWSNPDTLLSYLDRQKPEPIATDPAEEHFFVGLRLDAGIEPSAAEWERFRLPIERWIQEGMLERAGARLRLTLNGVLLSNEIFQEFLDVH